MLWRAAYNVGLGGLLRAQSRTAWLTRWVSRLVPGSLAHRVTVGAVRRALRLPRDAPLPPGEFVAWMVARQAVNVVLPNDVVAFVLAAVRYIDAGFDCDGAVWPLAGQHQLLCDCMIVCGYLLGVALVYASTVAKIQVPA